MSDPVDASKAVDLAWAQAWAEIEDAHGGFPGTAGGLLRRVQRASERRGRIPFYPNFPSLQETLEAPSGKAQGSTAEARS